MENIGRSRVWSSVFSTCHRIHEIVCTATELWWKVDFTRPRAACPVFLRSKGNPQMMTARLNWCDPLAEEALDHLRDKRLLHGHRLHTLDLCGVPSDMARFSWIFERSLPRLRHLRFHFSVNLMTRVASFPCLTRRSHCSRSPSSFQQTCACGCSTFVTPRCPGRPTSSPG